MSSTGQRHTEIVSHIEKLPNELIVSILTFTRNGHRHETDTLAKASRVCKRWRSTSDGILWSAIYLTDANILHFSKSQQSRSLKLTRRLVVSTSITRAPIQNRRSQKHQPPNKVRKRDQSLQQRFSRLITIISQMHHLATFSFFEMHGPDWHCVSRSSQTRVRRILNHLPLSVRSLQIDIDTCEVCEHRSRNCLSKVVGRLVPQLQHLRLRLPRLCPTLLARTDNLQSITINMCWTDMYGDCPCRPTGPNPSKNVKGLQSTPDNRSIFLKAAREYLHNSDTRSHKITNFTVLSTHNFDHEHCGPTHILLRDDLISQQTTAYPTWCINDEAGPEEELWCLRISDDQDPDKRDIIGTSSALEKYIEGTPCTDIQVSPSSYTKDVPETIKHQREVLMTPSTAQKVINNSHRSQSDCNLWTHEERANSKRLVRPQIVPLGEIPSLDMKIYGPCKNRERLRGRAVCVDG